MKVGHLIRAERIRQKMKQIVLARGICTPSYLSKIERNLIFPSEQIVTLLFNKLNIDVNMLQGNDHQTDIEYENILKVSYKEVITKRDESFTQQKLDELVKQSPLFENQSLYYTYQLITLRFRIILDHDTVQLKKDIETLDQISENFNSTHMYLFKINKALYYYTTKNQKKAIKYLEEVLSIIDTIRLENWEKAELNYIIGIIYTADNRIFTSIDYIRRALEYFRENFLMKRVLDCYIVIGITQKRSEQFQDALESYFKAKQICDEFKLTSKVGIIYHNLGSLSGIMGKNEEAIEYFKESIKYKSDKKRRLISIFGIIMELSKMNNKRLVNEWCDRGIELLVQLKDENVTSYYHHFNFFKSLHSDNGLSDTIAIQAIDYFKKIQDFQYIHKYSIALAEYYFTQRKYKLSSILYNEANRYGYIYRKNMKWEDL